MASVAKEKSPKESKKRGDWTSPTQAYIRTGMQVSHLDGLSHVHALDVSANYARLSPSLKASALAEAATLESFFHGSGPRSMLVSNIWFGDAGAGFETPDGHHGDPVVMEGANWQKRIMLADEYRFSWRDKSKKSRGATPAFDSNDAPASNGVPPFDAPEEIGATDDDQVQAKKAREMSGQLSKIYARLPAWVATAALADNIDRQTLVDAVTEVAKAFQVESGRRVIGANIHVETGHDIHIHLVHTDLVPEEILIKKDYEKSTLVKIKAAQRKVAVAALVERNNLKPSMKERDAEVELMYLSGRLVDPLKGRKKTEYRKIERPASARKHLLSMGPGYCSKTTLWEASGRDPAVVAVNARTATYSFKNRVLSKIGPCPGTGRNLEPEDLYLDYWLWKKWTSEVVSKLPEITRSRLPKIAREYVARYIEFGDSLPNPSMAEATDKAETRVFLKLKRFRLAGDGKEAPRLEKGQRTVDGVLGMFSDILQKKESNALMRGMRQAYEIVFSTKVPETKTQEEVECEIKEGVSGMVSSSIIQAWKSVYTFLVPGQKFKEGTPEAIQKDVRMAISRRITRGVNAALTGIGDHGMQESVPPEFPDLPAQPDELDEKVGLTASEFKRKANRSALESAWREINFSEDDVELKDMDDASLLGRIRKLAGKFREGVAESAKAARRSVVEMILGKNEIQAELDSGQDPVYAARDRIRHWKTVEEQAGKVIWELDELRAVERGTPCGVALARLRHLLPEPEPTPPAPRPPPETGGKEKTQGR